MFDKRQLPLDRLQVVGLQMQQIVIVVDAQAPESGRQRQRHAGADDQARPAREPRQPAGLRRQRNGRGDRLLAAIEDHQQCGQDGETGQRAQEDAAACDPAQFGHGLEVREHGRKERQGQGRRGGQVADGDMCGRVQEGRAHIGPEPAGLLITHHPQHPVVAHADEHYSEGSRKDVEVPHGQGQPAHGPGGAHEQRADRQQRISDAAIDNQEQHRDARDGQQGCQMRIVLGRGHLVRLENRQARKAQFQIREGPARVGHDRVHGVHALLRRREGASLLDGPYQQEGERAVAAEKILRLGQEVLLFGRRRHQALPGVVILRWIFQGGGRRFTQCQKLR